MTREQRALALLEWFAKGGIGTSSKTLALASVGMKPEGHFGSDAPHDEDDSSRCEFLARMCPFVVEALPGLIAENSRWADWEERIRDAANKGGKP